MKWGLRQQQADEDNSGYCRYRCHVLGWRAHVTIRDLGSSSAGSCAGGPQLRGGSNAGIDLACTLASPDDGEVPRLQEITRNSLTRWRMVEELRTSAINSVRWLSGRCRFPRQVGCSAATCRRKQSEQKGPGEPLAGEGEDARRRRLLGEVTPAGDIAASSCRPHLPRHRGPLDQP